MENRITIKKDIKEVISNTSLKDYKVLLLYKNSFNTNYNKVYPSVAFKVLAQLQGHKKRILEFKSILKTKVNNVFSFEQQKKRYNYLENLKKFSINNKKIDISFKEQKKRISFFKDFNNNISNYNYIPNDNDNNNNNSVELIEKIKTEILNKYSFDISFLNKIDGYKAKHQYFKELIKYINIQIKNIKKDIKFKTYLKPLYNRELNLLRSGIITNKAKQLYAFFICNKVQKRSYSLNYNFSNLILKSIKKSQQRVLNDLFMNHLN